MFEIPQDPWPIGVTLLPEKFGRRANGFYLPLSLRILKRKKKRREKRAAINELCSVRKAFSSMVFIVQVLQRHAIRMRADSFSSSNLHNQGILARVHDELQSSFVWLFQHIFSATPTLMVYLMLLLANFTIFSITVYPPNAAGSPSSLTDQRFENPTIRFDSAAITAFSIGGSSSVVADRSVDGECDRSLSSLRNADPISPEILSADLADEEYARAWKAILQEAERIRANERHEALSDPDTLRRFVSPVSVVLESEDLSAFWATELSYRRALAKDPDDPLNLSNFAQFLYLVLRDYDSAEEYFKRAARAELRDAEVLCRYANFLWVAKQDFSAAEEIFLEAIALDPGNSYYSANYAHFLWSTGGVDTCYPLDLGDP